MKKLIIIFMIISIRIYARECIVNDLYRSYYEKVIYDGKVKKCKGMMGYRIGRNKDHMLILFTKYNFYELTYYEGKQVECSVMKINELLKEELIVKDKYYAHKKGHTIYLSELKITHEKDVYPIPVIITWEIELL